MLDYNQVKRRFAQHLAADLEGIGRIESAAYHTVEWVYAQGIAEHQALLKRIADLEIAIVSAIDQYDSTNAEEVLDDLSRHLNNWQLPRLDPAFGPTDNTPNED